MSENQQQTALAPIAGGSRGLAVTDIDGAIRFATAAYNSGIAPSGHKNAQSVFVAMQLGMEMGLPAMAAIQNIMVVNGRPSIWGDAMLAVCRKPGIFDEKEFVEKHSDDGKIASCWVRRLPDGNVICRQYSMEDAKRAGLLGKDNWIKYQKRMLQMRARSWALKDAFPDLLLGLLTVEESQDIPPAGISDAAAAHIEHIKRERERVTIHDVTNVEPDMEPPSNPPTPEEVDENAPTDDQIINGRAMIKRIEAAVSFSNFDACEADAVNLANDGRLSQVDCVTISEMIADGRGKLSL